mgnify:CR=1 FL=1
MTYMELDQHRPPDVLRGPACQAGAWVPRKTRRNRLEPAALPPPESTPRSCSPPNRFGPGSPHRMSACRLDRHLAAKANAHARGSSRYAASRSGSMCSVSGPDRGARRRRKGRSSPTRRSWSGVALLMAILIGAPLLARKNLARGRGDRRGLSRLAVFIFVVHLAIWATRSHVIARPAPSACSSSPCDVHLRRGPGVDDLPALGSPYVRRNAGPKR